MALLAVAYPHLTAPDSAWIQAIRQQHDAHYPLIAPHVTLVFPISTLTQAAFVAHIQAQAIQAGPIAFSLRCTMLVKDGLSPMSHLFLVPDEGFSALVRLHDALYRTMLADALRLDIPFIPHITVGDCTDLQHGKALVDAINRQNRSIHGSITAIDVISYENDTILPVARIELT